MQQYGIENKMQLPTIHHNGTSKVQLVEDLCTARSRLHDAMVALSLISPHGRDYYPQGEKAFKRAVDEHVARLKKLEEVYQELYELAQAIDELG